MGIFEHLLDDARQQNTEDQQLFAPAESGEACFCSSCGSAIKDSYQFCPFCGERNSLFMPVRQAENLSSMYNKLLTFRDLDTYRSTLDYLQLIGRASQAQKIFRVKVSVPGNLNPVVLELPGACRSYDAMDLLCKLHYIDDDDRYTFDDWPKADEIIGSIRHHISACVCELRHKVYHVRAMDERDLQVLYGCPNVHALTNHIPKKTVEVIEYD